ncbi:MAG: class I SAM-dependent methyltransferase, partial [Chloroflexota bacterium]
MNDKISTDGLTGVMETLLPVLYSRVVESQREDAIFHDPIAIEWAERIDYDFSRFDADKAPLNHLGVAIRTEILDEYVSNFLERHPSSTVVNIAAGLDTRFYRMDNGKVQWRELDLAPSIAVREKLMSKTERHFTVTASALETQWMDILKQQLPTNAPILFVVEGLLMYFTETQIKGLLSAIAERFAGAELLLEVLGESQAKKTHLNDAISQTSAQFKFGIRDTSQMAAWHAELTFLGDTSIYDRHVDRWLALDIDWKGKSPSAYRDKTDRIVHLQVAKTEQTTRTATVLLVDDNRDLRLNVTRVLNDAGHYAYAAENGKVALEKLDDIAPDIIICDMVMPIMDGIAFVNVIRQREALANTPIIMLTIET